MLSSARHRTRSSAYIAPSIYESGNSENKTNAEDGCTGPMARNGSVTHFVVWMVNKVYGGYRFPSNRDVAPPQPLNLLRFPPLVLALGAGQSVSMSRAVSHGAGLDEALS